MSSESLVGSLGHPLPPFAALSPQKVSALHKCAEDAGVAERASQSAQAAAVQEKQALSAELRAARDEVASILEASKSIQAQLSEATGAMQVLQGKVDSMTAERDGLTARIARSDADLQVRACRACVWEGG